MTNEEKEMAVTMLESGCSYGQVARNLNKNKTYIYEMFSEKCGRKQKEAGNEKRIRASKCPALCRYLIEEEYTLGEFANVCYLSEGVVSRLLGTGKASKNTIEQVCRVTGMSEDELFRK